MSNRSGRRSQHSNRNKATEEDSMSEQSFDDDEDDEPTVDSLFEKGT